MINKGEAQREYHGGVKEVDSLKEVDNRNKDKRTGWLGRQLPSVALGC